MIDECKGCGQRKKLVKSHIIPQSLHQPIRDTGGNAFLYSSDPKIRPRMARTGVYERLLCEDCEKGFQDYDDYAARFFRTTLPAYPPIRFAADLVFAAEATGIIQAHSGALGRQVIPAPAYNYARLKLFLLAVLWRATLASHDFFRYVDLGPHEPRIRTMVRNGDPGDADEYSTFIVTFDDREATSVSFNPRKVRFYGVNGYRFLLGGCSTFIKVDKRRMPAPYDTYIMRPNEPLVVSFREWKSSPERGAILQAVAAGAGG